MFSYSFCLSLTTKSPFKFHFVNSKFLAISHTQTVIGIVVCGELIVWLKWLFGEWQKKLRWIEIERMIIARVKTWEISEEEKICQVLKCTLYANKITATAATTTVVVVARAHNNNIKKTNNNWTWFMERNKINGLKIFMIRLLEINIVQYKFINVHSTRHILFTVWITHLLTETERMDRWMDERKNNSSATI